MGKRNSFKENETQLTMFDEEGNTLFDAEVFDKDLDSTVFDENIDEPSVVEESENNVSHLGIGSILIAKYTIKKILGQGGLGIAYLAEETGSNNQVVIKEFFPKQIVKRTEDSNVSVQDNATEQQLKSYNRMKDVFEEEAKNLVKVNRSAQHKNVAGFIALENNVNNTVYFIMPYTEGEDLTDYLEQLESEGKKLSQDEILELAKAVLDGLSHIHQYDVYHKDIKPSNIYIKSDGTPMLIDFGASVTSAHLLTPSYAPIEQVNKMQSEYGPYTDIYAVGVMLYEMLLGNKPPKAKERAEAVARGEIDPYKPLSKNRELTKKFDAHFLKAIDHSLKLAYRDRPQTAKVFKEELTGDLQRKKRNKIILWSVIGAVILSGIGYGVNEMTRDKIGSFELLAEEGGKGVKGVDVYIDGVLEKPNAKSNDGNDVYYLDEDNHILRVEKSGLVSTYPKYKLNIKEGAIERKKVEFVKDEIDLVVKTVDEKTQKPLNTTIKIGDDKFTFSATKQVKLFYDSNKSGLNQKFKIFATQKGYLDSEVKMLTYQELLKTNEIILPLVKKEGSVFIKYPKNFKISIDDKVQKDNNGNDLTTPVTITGLSEGEHNLMLYSVERQTIGNKYMLQYKPIKEKIVVEHNKILALKDFKKEELDTYKNAKKRVDEKLSNGNDKENRKKEVLSKAVIPKTKVVSGVNVGETEVTYNELVRFLNSNTFSNETLIKYFYTTSSRVSMYIKWEEDDKGTVHFYVTKGYENYPVTYISWHGAKAYTKWLSKQTGQQYRLPTSNEWKSIAKVGFDVATLDKYANHSGNSLGISAVKTKKANKSGVYDIFGNVSEWCEDQVGHYSRVIRGGSYITDKQYMNPYKVYSMNESSTKNRDLGFRVVRD